MVLLETERLFLREWVPDDWKRYKPLATDPRVLRYIAGGLSSDERIRRFVDGGIEKAKRRGWILWPVIHRRDSELIGFCGFGDGFPPDVEIGWRLRPEYWRQGLATEMARAVMEYGWQRFQFERLIAVIHPGNRASIRVAEKLGMMQETTFTYRGLEVLRYAKMNPQPEKERTAAGGRRACLKIVEQKVSAGGRDIFDLDEFLSRPLYAHLAHSSSEGARESPIWFHWDGEALWIIGGTTFPENLKRDPRCAIGIVDWNAASGLSQHVGLRGRAEVLPFDSAMVRTIFRKYFGPDESSWDPRFREDIDGETGVPLVRFLPETAVMRDQSYSR